MTLLLNHLEQISSSARTIGELPFPPPKIFTNALLGNHEITTLIRDTEPHERALFSAEPTAKGVPAQRRSTRRTTAFSADDTRRPALLTALPRKQSAVVGLLGPHMLQEIGGYGENGRARKSGGVNVKVLLEGAEKLCTVYPVAGAPEKITSMRNRFNQVAESVAMYEAKVANQTSQLDLMNNILAHGQDYDEENEEVMGAVEARREVASVTEDELRAEEQEIKELEQKKRALEERVASMEKDLGGLLR